MSNPKAVPEQAIVERMMKSRSLDELKKLKIECPADLLLSAYKSLSDEEREYVAFLSKADHKAIAEATERLRACASPNALQAIEDGYPRMLLRIAFKWLNEEEKINIHHLKSLPVEHQPPVLLEKEAIADNDGCVDFLDLISENNALLGILGWDRETCVRFLYDRYKKKSRQILTDEELLDYCECIRQLAKEKSES